MMAGLQEVFVRRDHQPREPPRAASGLYLVRQFERKEKMEPYPSDLERFPNGRPPLKTLPGLYTLHDQLRIKVSLLRRLKPYRRSTDLFSHKSTETARGYPRADFYSHRRGGAQRALALRLRAADVVDSGFDQLVAPSAQSRDGRRQPDVGNDPHALGRALVRVEDA